LKLKYFLVPFSYIFHPLFISVYGALLYFWLTNTFENTTIFYLTFLQIIILTTLLPLSFYWLLFSLKKVKHFTEASLKERRLPIFAQILMLFFLVKYSLVNELFPELHLFFVGAFFSAFLVFISVICRFKASLHLIGCSSLLVFIYILMAYLEIQNIYVIIALVLCTGFVASSRLFLKAHTPIELIVGLLIGGLPQVFVWFYKM
jgi:hypothetical protein